MSAAGSIPSARTLQRRLQRLYDAASEAERREGREWYADATEIAEALAAASPYSVDQCAYVIAALSPRLPWPENVSGATTAVESHARGIRADRWSGNGLGANKAKAERILSGDLGALSGPKVTVFARAILGDPDAVTVDIWMQRACKLRDDRAPSRVEIAAVTAAVHRVAEACGETPRDLQAIVWVHYRNAALRDAPARLSRLRSDAGRARD